MHPADIEQLLKPTRVDLAIAGLFPKWGAKRMQARREFAYEAARNTRLRGSAKTLTGPEDYSSFSDRMGLIKQVRDLEQNFGLFQSIIDKLAMYAFGRVRYQAHTGIPELDKIYEEYLEERFAGCDLSGRHDIGSMVRIAFKSHIRDGDYALKWQRHMGQLKLTGIEGDRIGGNITAGMGEDYFQGIFVDRETGRPVSYKIYDRTKANSYVNPVEVRAGDIIHYFDPRRYDQYRGITPFAPVINEARDLKEVLEACLVGTKFENYHSALGYTDSGLPLNDPTSFINGTETNAQGAGLKEQELKFGVVQWAPTGSKVDFIKSERPSANFQSYLDMLIRLQGIALNLPHSFIYSMLGLTGPGARMEAQQAHRTIQYHQENGKNRVLNPIKNTYLMEGIANGEIPYAPKWNRGSWQFPPAPTIDVGRESAAGINEVKAGLRSKTQWFAENGDDAEEEEGVIAEEADRTLTRAKELSEKHDVPLDVALNLLEVRTPNGLMVSRSASVESADILETPVKPDTDPKQTESEDLKTGFQAFIKATAESDREFSILKS